MMRLHLAPATISALRRIRLDPNPTGLYGVDELECQNWLSEVTESLLAMARLDPAWLDAYRCFLTQFGHVCRTRQADDLAFHIELLIRQWTMNGLDQHLLERLFCEVSRRLRPVRETLGETRRLSKCPAA